jgi:hypothetical protein
VAVPSCAHCEDDYKVGPFWLCERCGTHWPCDERVYLIESRLTPGPLWWRAGPCDQWTHDALEAIRFFTKAQAESVLLTLADAHVCFISEHVFF